MPAVAHRFCYFWATHVARKRITNCDTVTQNDELRRCGRIPTRQTAILASKVSAERDKVLYAVANTTKHNGRMDALIPYDSVHDDGWVICASTCFSECFTCILAFIGGAPENAFTHVAGMFVP